MDDYLKDPHAIEMESFRIIRELTDLGRFSGDAREVAMRLVHTSGDPAIVEQLRISDGALERGLEAIAGRRPVLCDVEMVRHGLTRRYLAVDPLCFLNYTGVPEVARARGESRTMCAVDHWHSHLAGSVVIIGNAPTALYRLLERLADGWPPPALIIGMPVGFVGAAEAKQVLWDRHRRLDTSCITLLGRTGGSALAAAVFNTLLRLQHGERYDTDARN